MNALLLALAGLAAAQSPTDPAYEAPAVQVDPWRIATDARLAPGVDDAAIAPGALAVAQWRHADDLLLYKTPSEVVRLVDAVDTLRLGAGWSWQRARVALTVPMIVRLRSDLAPGWLTAVGDPHLDAKFQFAPPESGVGLALTGRISAPLGAHAHLLGDRTPTAEAAVVVERGFGPVVGVMNVGGQLAGGADLGPQRLGSAFQVRAALAWDLGPAALFAEAHARTRFQGKITSPVDWLAGARVPVGEADLWLGGGGPIVSGVGTPAWQALVGVHVRGRQSTHPSAKVAP